jgi:hypothetical protein
MPITTFEDPGALMFKFLKDSWRDAKKQVEEEERARALASSAGTSESKHPLPDMSALAHEFAATVSQQGLTLDFTPPSLLVIDGLLATMRERLARLPAADKERQRQENIAAARIGAYVGEVLRREGAGEWSLAKDGLPGVDLGQGVAPIVGSVLNLLSKGHLDMPDGPVNSLVPYYEVFARACVIPLMRRSHESLQTPLHEMSDDSELADWLIDMTAEAVRAGRTSWNVELDFTPESLEAVEEGLGKLHDALKAGPNDRLADKRIEVIALKWGAYVGEVFRRHYGGKWTVVKPERVL